MYTYLRQVVTKVNQEEGSLVLKEREYVHEAKHSHLYVFILNNYIIYNTYIVYVQGSKLLAI